MSNTQTYKVFKGLQKPLEFIGLKGRYVWYALGGGVGSIILGIILLITVNFTVALIVIISLPSALALWISKSMKRGLHAKKSDEGVYIVTSVIQRKPYFNEQKKAVRSPLSHH